MPLILTDASKMNILSQQNNKLREQKQQQNTRNTIQTREGAQLFVNGKERKIGKKSQYLLDMLTLED